MLALHAAKRPIYCDTDSIICESLPADFLGETLGKWKLEASGHVAVICERKTYCLLGDVAEGKEGQRRLAQYGDARCVKLASKGVRLSVQQLIDVANGETVEYMPEAPTIRIDGSQLWQGRKIRMNRNDGRA
jgi:hypothetical protein